MPLNDQQLSDDFFPADIPIIDGKLFSAETPRWREFPHELFLVRGLDNRGVAIKSRIFVRSYDALTWAILLKTNAVLGGRTLFIYVQSLWSEEIEPSVSLEEYLKRNGLFTSRIEAEAFRIKSHKSMNNSE
jgi:hypothetical protein